LKRYCPIFQKVALTVSKQKKCQIIYNKAHLKSPKHLRQTNLKCKNTYDKSCFENANLGKNVINFHNSKGAQNVAISFGCFIFTKNHNEPPKVAQLAKKSPNRVTLENL
jgi:hypothetical protein